MPGAWLLLRSRQGLKVRAAGEHPEALESAGGNVIRIRYLCVVATGMLAGLGGVYLSIGQTDTFEEGLVGGRGFIALGVAIVGRRHPFGVLAAALLFALAESLQLWLPDGRRRHPTPPAGDAAVPGHDHRAGRHPRPRPAPARVPQAVRPAGMRLRRR